METVDDSSTSLTSAPLAASSASSATPVARISAQIMVEGKDVSRQLAPYLIELEYTDSVGGVADSVEITLDNSDHRWENDWYPNFGDQLEIQMGYDGQTLLPCGVFEIDEVDLEGPPDIVRIKALSTGVKKSLRSRLGIAYENTTLADIVTTLAKRNGLTVKGSIEAIQIVRVTQAFETDLAFLKRLAKTYGYDFSVRGNVLTFYKRDDLKTSVDVLTLQRRDVTSYHFHDKVHEIYTAATVSYHHVKQKRIIKQRVPDAAAGGSSFAHASADELNINVRAEDDGQAQLKAKVALAHANDDQTTLQLTLYGNTALMAGINVKVDGFGQLNGKYTVTSSTHRLSRQSGYVSMLALKRVRSTA